MLAPLSVRSRKIENGISGASTRVSQTDEERRAGPPRRRRARSSRQDVQPNSLACVIA